jgi:hypothetical protein
VWQSWSDRFLKAEDAARDVVLLTSMVARPPVMEGTNTF